MTAEVDTQSVTEQGVTEQTGIEQSVTEQEVVQEDVAPQDTPAQTTTAVGSGGQRPDSVTLLAGYHFLVGTLMLLGTCGLAIPTVITGIVGIVEDPEAFIATFILGIIAAIVMLLSLVYLSVGYGLWTQRQWARTAAIAIGVVSLFGVPIGTIIGGVTIWYLLKEDVAATFS